MAGHLKIIQSGYTVEVWQYEKISTASGRLHTRKRRNRESYFYIPKSAYNARQRRKAFERLVRANLDVYGAPVLMTLTMRDIEPLKASWRHYSKFMMRLKYKHPNVLAIAVPEFQKRGAVHFHVLLWGLSSEYVKSERETRYIAHLWRQGFVDLIQGDSRPQLVGYLSKYLTKTYLDFRLRDQRCYSASRRCERATTSSSPTLY